jgi:hypothetical protein
MCQSLKDILEDKDNQWQPLVDKKGKAIDGQATFRMRHFMGEVLNTYFVIKVSFQCAVHTLTEQNLL